MATNFPRRHKRKRCPFVLRVWCSTGGLVIVAAFLPFLSWQAGAQPHDAPVVRFETGPGKVQILVGDRPFATYVYQDEKIPRPYFCDVRAADGIQVTRNHPPIKGIDLTDHGRYHPGIWLAFGDINGADFWRNRARVQHEKFIEEPTGGPDDGWFTVQNVYLADDNTVVCREICRYDLVIGPMGHFLLHESVFFSDTADFVFGDQEEMGLGIRLATPLIVRKGGTITNSAGLKNEEEAWGKQAAWCDYSAIINDRRHGIALMPHPENFRMSWFHARDYGLLVANPFGRNAFTGGEKSAVVVKKAERFTLRFGIFIYCTEPGNMAVPTAAYQEYLRLIERSDRSSDPGRATNG